VPAAVAFNEVPLTVHTVPVTAKLTAPSPDPPDDVSVIAVPAVPVNVVFVTDSVAWDAAVKLNVFTALVACK
jgi:hypothetical protein